MHLLQTYTVFLLHGEALEYIIYTLPYSSKYCVPYRLNLC